MSDDRVTVGRLEWDALERRLEVLSTALEHFANPQHWAVSRRFTTPEHVWIGTVQTHPSVLAREALEGSRTPSAVTLEAVSPTKGTGV
jgi:hypothetical protein